MIEPTNRWRILTSPIAADIDADCLRWHETVWQVTEDLQELYLNLPTDYPLEKEIKEILARLKIANRQAEESFQELRHGNVCH